MDSLQSGSRTELDARINQIVALLADFTPEVMLNAPTKSELVASDLTQTEPMASSIQDPGQGDAADQGTPREA